MRFSHFPNLEKRLKVIKMMRFSRFLQCTLLALFEKFVNHIL